MSTTVHTPVSDFSLDDRYVLDDGTVYLTGIQALVRTLRDRAILDRRHGRRTASFVSGYEGSPLAGYDLEIARKKKILDGFDIVHRPAVNEELAATSVLGTQMAPQVGRMRTDAVTGYWYGKSPGLDRASDAIRHANLVGTDPRGGAVALVGDDPGGKSSSLACASEVAMADLLIPTLYPADPQEVLDYGLHAPFLSRFTGLWSGLKIVTAVADGAGTAVVHPDRIDPSFGDLGPSTYTPSAHLVGPNLLTLERSQLHDRLPRALEYARINHLNRIVCSGPDDRIGLVTSGKTYLDLREALTVLGLDETDLRRFGIRILKLGMIYPVDPQIVHTFADGLTEIIVVEEKRAFLETALRDILYRRPDAPLVLGKTDPTGKPLVNAFGELDADLIAGALARRLGGEYEIEPVQRWRERPQRSRIVLPLLARTPYFCSGCPHNSSTKVAPDTLIGGGIGCHAMVMMMDDKQVGDVIGLTQMGGEGAQWIGMAPFLEEDHFVQNVGDGTFMHSGSLALRAAVASGENITYKLLYNATVAMTGGQDPVGAMPLDRITRLLLAEGVRKIVVTTEDRTRIKALRLPRGVDVRDRDELVQVQQELATVPGVTVLIHDQECAAEKRRKRKRGTIDTPTTRVMINERICEGCGDCGEKSNCLSVHPVETEFGRKTTIHQSSCNLDYSCLKGDCPSFVTITPGPVEQRTPVPDITTGLIRDPEFTSMEGEFGMRILGVGGTGVVTVSQILATAAVIDGKFVRSLDQTGLAQKGGAVVSDLKLGPHPFEQGPKIGQGRCNLYLACDSLVGTDPTNLKAADPDTTIAVVSTTEIPTGQMVVDTSVHFPGLGTIRTAVDGATRRAVYLDPATLSRELFGDEQYTNMLLVGAAYQTGVLPIAAHAIERAITLNGAAVDANLQAFRRGRQAVADPEALAVAIEANRRAVFTPAPPSARALHIAANVRAEDGSELARLVALRTADLIDYQDSTYATEYALFVERVRAREAVAVDGSTTLAETVAQNLYKLMAYKDEYEVARLALDPAFDAAVTDTFGTSAKRAVRLHPPLLRAMGMKNKLSLGSWVNPGFKTLHRMRRIRGTRLDIFGYHRIRKMERALIDEYRTVIETLLQDLTPAILAAAVDIAALPDMIRGYEQIKVANVEAYHRRLTELLAAYPNQDAVIAPAC
ncbi:indolepyruvate ferredoxin oxidoreductase family protein [Rhodococcus aetherivorans]|uniref:Indolepyruvate ferredoxin oxidoreductase family protein n=1 Tax=Rhodococcus aetherivorans TaxID=191292 RepID=A0AA46NVE9_9NOCA|nr:MULTISPECIES: indolepyruvate ferredoxin oxidoreductase family protein [Rhodococcus]UYF94313.1 indolepyruvate ferredoxin oxidoreductase family protein [Rhodococcus aetherivorans]